MASLNELLSILEEEYGIKSMADLDEAISKLGCIDISPFCGEIGATAERLSISKKWKEAIEA